MQYLRIVSRSFGEEDFQMFALHLLYSYCLWLLITDNVGGAAICTNFNYTYPRTICVQNPGILLCNFGEEDF